MQDIKYTLVHVYQRQEYMQCDCDKYMVVAWPRHIQPHNHNIVLMIKFGSGRGGWVLENRLQKSWVISYNTLEHLVFISVSFCASSYIPSKREMYFFHLIMQEAEWSECAVQWIMHFSPPGSRYLPYHTEIHYVEQTFYLYNKLQNYSFD